jgi:hypothetical protein
MPMMITAKLDTIMTMPCKKSVHTTAFMPPCKHKLRRVIPNVYNNGIFPEKITVY